MPAMELTRDEVRRLITATGDDQQALFERARAVRRERCGNAVLLRGLVEISNYCQKKCDYCAMRAPNRELERYRLTAEQILEVVAEIKRHNLNIAFLQGGQDPRCDEILEEVIPVIKREMGLPVLLCLGERPKRVYERFVELGADSYILKIEASDPDLYRQTIHAPIESRLQCTRWIQESGMKLGTGNITGLPGQTLDHLVGDIFFAAGLKPDFVSSAPFIPNEDTPFEEIGFGPLGMTLNTMAIWRIMLGDPLIPTVSPLEKIQRGGQLMGLNAGANVMTINFTPTEWREKYAIYSRERFVVTLDHAYETIERAGLRPVGTAVRSNGSAARRPIEVDPATVAFEHRHVTAPLLSLGLRADKPNRVAVASTTE
jgi:biotin synthase